MVTHNRRAVLKTVGSVAVIGGLAGCASNGGQDGEGDDGEDAQEGQQEGAESDIAEVRVAHLSPDAPNVDIYVDGESALEDVGYRDVSEYTELQAGSYDVRVTETGTDEALYEDTVEVETGTYTLAAIGEDSEENEPLDIVVIEDDLSDPGENARLTVLHASPDAPAVDINNGEGGDALVEGLAFGETQTLEAPPGDYTLAVAPADGGDAVATFDVSLEAGGTYSAFAVGYLEPDDAPVDEPFDLEVVRNDG